MKHQDSLPSVSFEGEEWPQNAQQISPSKYGALTQLIGKKELKRQVSKYKDSKLNYPF